MIAFTSQLCHIIATSYARDELVPETPGFSAGSYANMTRIATQNADIWSALYASNRDALVPVLDRFIARLSDFRAALAADNVAAMKQMIDEGTAAKGGFVPRPISRPTRHCSLISADEHKTSALALRSRRKARRRDPESLQRTRNERSRQANHAAARTQSCVFGFA